MSEQLNDTRTRARGWPVVIIAALCVGAAVFVWRAVVAVTEAVVAGNYLVAVTTIVAALTWLAGCVGVVHNGKRMRRLAAIAWLINLLGAGAGLIWPEYFARVSPWFEAGSTYYYLPTLGVVVALAWLAWSRPAALAARQ
ncbi:hypothetical protein [Trueperella bialowiezensis]|uniref:hypothetical protein n=1 Tax=Trueperella bialowiezensis TaxID=312285 RepID=UPI001F53FF51|nr:hypothetical protein [Trueperella bialowiezensis]